MRALLHQRQPALELTADAIATMVTERRIEEILERAEEADNNEDNNVTGTLEVAKMLKIAVMQFDRKKILAQMAQAGLLCFTSKCRKVEDDKVPRFITLVTAPIDRFEYEAQVQRMKKRLESYPSNNETRGPRVDFRMETEDEPYPYHPYYAPPVLDTSTGGCVFTHEEREDLIGHFFTS